MSVEQMVRDLLETAIKEKLVKPGYRKDPQDYSSGELIVVAQLMASYLKQTRKGCE